MSKKLFFNFYGVGVEVTSSWDEPLNRLAKDFSFFTCEEVSTLELNLCIVEDEEVFDRNTQYTYKSSKVAFYERDGERVCNYHNKIQSRINFENGNALVKGKDINGVHEVSYLLILSRVGKALDQLGFHRLHAGAFEKDNILFLALFPSGGGKSTLISTVMKDRSYHFFSDDSPLIKSDYTVVPFPIRIGFEENAIPKDLENIPSYSLKRFRYGMKNLFSLEDLNWPVGSSYQKVILISGSRGERASYAQTFGLSHLFHILKEGVIGVGLPILYEYFWEYGSKDFMVKMRITLKRMKTLIGLWLKAKKYQVTLESDLDKNKLMLENLIKEERN